MIFQCQKIITVILLSLFVALPALAYYNPGNPTGFVNDYANVLTAEQKAALESKLSQLEQDSSNQVSIAIIKSLDGDTVDKFAVKLFEDWGIGQKDKNNGVLILVAIEDKKMRIEVGYGLEGALTDAQNSWIISDVMRPAFQKNDYYGGMDGAVDKIISATKGEYVPAVGKTSGSKISGDLIEFFFAFGFFIFIWLASILARSKSWWAGGVIGGVAGVIIALVKGFILWGVISLAVFIPLGLLLDFIVSKKYQGVKKVGGVMPWWIGGPGRFGGGSGGGFGGFGGGSSGGGGASGGW